MQGTRRGELYVGYRPAPARHRGFLRVAVPALLLVIVGMAGMMAAAQRDPGEGVWATGTPTEHSGLLTMMPYPVLLTDDGAAYLVVEMGKVGAAERLAPYSQGRVRLRGWTLQRNRERMIELDTAEDAVQRDTGPIRMTALSPSARSVQLSGEILDSKCFLGAMKPGDGKGHKACATLCIDGGIPPAILTWDTLGRPRTVLLRAATIEETIAAVRPYLGEPVELRGLLTSVGNLEVLSIEAGSIRRR